MGDPLTAAQDPIFWLHHANIDRLWNHWLQQGGGRADPTDSALCGASDRRRAYLDAGKARAQNFVRTFAPSDPVPSMFRQAQRQFLDAHSLPWLAATQYCLHLNCVNDSSDIAEAKCNRGKFPGGGSQGLESMIQARDGSAHP